MANGWPPSLALPTRGRGHYGAILLPQLCSKNTLMEKILKIFQIIFAVAGFGVAFAMPAFADEEFATTLLGAGIGGAIGSTIGHGDGRALATGTGIVLGGVVGSELGRPSYGSSSLGPTFGPSYGSYPFDMFSSQIGAPYQPNYVAPSAPPPPPPITYVEDDSGQYCRAFSETVRVGNQIRETYGTVCLQPDGSWHVVQ